MNAQTTVEQFLAAFRRFDLDAMLSCFDPDATAFFPAERATQRLENLAAIREAFRAAIARAQERGTVGIALTATEVRSAEWGETALVTAHLRDDLFGRRTFVLRRNGGSWRIAHLHASNAVS